MNWPHPVEDKNQIGKSEILPVDLKNLHPSLKIAATIIGLLFIGWPIFAQSYEPDISNLTSQPRQILFQLQLACPPSNNPCSLNCVPLDKDYLTNLVSSLDNKQLAPELQNQFKTYEVLLSDQLTVSVVTAGQVWLISDTSNAQTYYVDYSQFGLRAFRVNSSFPNFSDTFSSQIPHDVDKAFSEALMSKAFDSHKQLVDSQQLALAQRLHDILAWQSFLAIQWPVDDQGQAQINLTDAGPPRWTTWMNSPDVFKADGSKPVWGSSDTSRIVEAYQVSHLSGDPNGDQLWDQNGNLVYYQMLINQVEFNDILCKKLYNRNGQNQLYQQAQKEKEQTVIQFHWGEPDRNGLGSIELKLAWKIMDPAHDISSRYFTKTVQISLPDPDHPGQQKWVEQEVGLVGMHIAHKTLSSMQWVWSTFEHIDNVQVNELETGGVNGEALPLKPSFYDPNCSTCPVNVPPTPDANGLRKSQVMRIIPISEDTTELNQQVQQLLKEAGSVWQYYELIGAQWATSQFAAAASGAAVGNPTPVYLGNSVIETYFPQSDQSCMGCHSRAGLAFVHQEKEKVLMAPGVADFSWLLWMESKWDTTKSGN